ncbi:hypothetical protein CYMTET_54876 [Cymbomonas tetramitiformis]|uniref:PHD-type domain-containing protein n=1 Tax=Cymbomonas tetramitiformis TaxID=36881 RepID=A0AAE0ENX3_9CHLO|nr:hypothetical protein CYMTET_54876 [Cymbomonas tetramitiformis]
MEAITEEEPNELENSMDSLGSAVTEEASSENEPEERNVVDAAAQSHDPVFLESGAEVLDSMGGYSDDFEGSELSSCHDRANDCSDSGAILNVPQQEIERNSSGSAEGCFSATGTQPRTPLKPEAGDVFRDELRQLQLQAENEGSQYFAQYDNLVPESSIWIQVEETKAMCTEVDNRLAEVIGEETGEDPFNLLLTWPALTEDGIIAPEVAALRIQKVVRGRQGRLDARRHQHAYLTLQSHFRGYQARTTFRQLRQEKAVTTIAAHQRRRMSQQELGKRRLQKQHQEAAVQIQAVVRGGKSRVLVKKFRSENAVCICGRMPFGEMIACIDCYDFFHFECVGLNPKLGRPQRTHGHGWRCPDCAFTMTNTLNSVPNCRVAVRKHVPAQSSLCRLHAPGDGIHKLLDVEPHLALSQAPKALWPKDAAQQIRQPRPLRTKGLSESTRSRLEILEPIRGKLHRHQRRLDHVMGKLLTHMQGLPTELPLVSSSVDVALSESPKKRRPRKAKPALPEEEMERNPALSKSGTSVSFLPSLVEPNNESTTEYQEAMEATSEREAEPLSLPPIHSERVMSGREQAAPASMEPTDKTTQKKPKVQKGIQKTKEVAQAFAGVETEGAATFDDFVRREGSVAGSDKSTKVKRKRNGKADKLSSPKEFGAARSQKV